MIRDGVDSLSNDRCSSCCDFDVDNSCVTNKTMLPVTYLISQHKDRSLPPKGREVINTVFFLPMKLFSKWLTQGCE